MLVDGTNVIVAADGLEGDVCGSSGDDVAFRVGWVAWIEGLLWDLKYVMLVRSEIEHYRDKNKEN